MFGDLLLDRFDGDRPLGFFMERVAQQRLQSVAVNLFAREGCVGGDANQGALQAADVGANPLREELNDLIGELHIHQGRLLLEDGDARFQRGRLEFGDQTPLEAGDQAGLEVRDLGGRPVAGKHDLLVRVEKGVEGVEELVLHPFFAAEELDVVDEQHIDLAVLLAKLRHGAVLDGLDEIVGELFAGDVADPADLAVAGRRVADGLHQVRLAQAHAAVDEQRVVGFGGRLRDRQRRGMGEVVVGADDEGVERVAGFNLTSMASRAAEGDFSDGSFGG